MRARGKKKRFRGWGGAGRIQGEALTVHFQRGSNNWVLLHLPPSSNLMKICRRFITRAFLLSSAGLSRPWFILRAHFRTPQNWEMFCSKIESNEQCLIYCACIYIYTFTHICEIHPSTTTPSLPHPSVMMNRCQDFQRIVPQTQAANSYTHLHCQIIGGPQGLGYRLHDAAESGSCKVCVVWPATWTQDA
jgi:hypothetical protein